MSLRIIEMNPAAKLKNALRSFHSAGSERYNDIVETK